jgi:hypothetical protein
MGTDGAAVSAFRPRRRVMGPRNRDLSFSRTSLTSLEHVPRPQPVCLPCKCP